MEPLKYLMLYRHSGPGHTVGPHVLYQLKAYRGAGIRIVFFSGAELNAEDLKKPDGPVGEISSGTRAEWLRRNGSALKDCDRLILADDSCFGPLFPPEEFLSAMAAKDCDYQGISYSTEEPEYIPSCFLLLAPQAFRSDAFLRNADAEDGGRTLHEALVAAGFRGEVFCRHSGMEYCADPRLKRALRAFVPAFLIRRRRMPFVRECDLFAWRDGHLFNETGEILEAIRDSGSAYPVSLIADHLRAARTLMFRKNLPETLLVTEHGPADSVRTALKLAVLAHFFYPDLFDEVLAYLRHFPFPFDFLISTCSEEHAAALREKIAAAGLPAVRTVVRVVQNRGRDVGPWLTAFNDLQEQYDLILKIHSKKSGKTPEVLPFEWSRHIYDSLMGSGALIRNIVSAFESQTELGVVFPVYPPVLQIGAPRWFSGVRTDAIRQWLDRCRLDPFLPEDERIPLFPVGTMFWYRPQALAPLFHCGVNVEEFPPEPFPAEGSSAHALERAVPYIAQANGYGFRLSVSLENLKNTFLRYEDHLMTRHADLDEKDLEIDRLNEVIRDYENSFCWRITKPVRLLADAVKKLLKKSGAR